MEYRCDNYDEIMAQGNVAGTLRAPAVETKVVQAPETVEPQASDVEVETKAAE
ncbi:MAG TPA: hypothetical protein VFH54_20005 [Mycobacteriales bacterium]|nr:hypothetical protein [Mycobacteriales bacterium]